jgi:alanine racemase
MTHFVSSEDASDATNDIQIARFASVRGALPHARASLANSSALFLPQKPFGDLVRPGYALYGGNPTPGAANPMRAVVRLEAPLLQTRIVEPGETVGYNAQWTAKRRTRLATIGVGYADGLPRAAMGIDDRPGGEAMVAGVRCAFAGRVSMDLTIIDVTDVPAEKLPGASALLLCDDITIDDLGLRAATIGYEILTRLGARYHRVYVE